MASSVSGVLTHWRKGNVDITAARYGVEQVSTIAELTSVVRRRIATANKALSAAD